MFFDGFVWFGNHGIRPALIALILYVGIMYLFFLDRKCAFRFKSHSVRLNFRKSFLYISSAVMFCLIQFYQSNGISEKSWLWNILESYLKIEDVLVAVLLLVTMLGFTFKGNAYQYLNIILKIVRYVCVISLYSNFLTGLCAYSYQNMVLLFIIWTTPIVTADCVIVEKKADDENKKSNYDPIETYTDLSSDFKRIADQIINIIMSDDSSTYSICLAGDWGIGKTSIMQGVEHKLKELSRKNKQQYTNVSGKSREESREYAQYEVIRINALELDTTESLFLYLFSRIKQILKEQGIYVGIGSTYRKFIGSAIDTLKRNGNLQVNKKPIVYAVLQHH